MMSIMPVGRKLDLVTELGLSLARIRCIINGFAYLDRPERKVLGKKNGDFPSATCSVRIWTFRPGS